MTDNLYHSRLGGIDAYLQLLLQHKSAAEVPEHKLVLGFIRLAGMLGWWLAG